MANEEVVRDHGRPFPMASAPARASRSAAPTELEEEAMVLRRIVLAISLASIGVAGVPGTAAGLHDPKVECGWHWWKGPWHVKQLIKCAANHEGVNVETALRVADCESDFHPGLYYNGNAGVFQHRLKYWSSRAATYGFEGWSPYNGRANVYVTMRMVKDTGWSPWSCY